MPGPLLLISNPKCGDGGGQTFVQTHVTPFLAEHGIPVDKTVVTDAPGHAGIEVLKFLDEHKEDTSVSLIVSSGDGTLHEIINSVYSAGDELLQQPRRFQVALVPSGTANALFSSLFPPKPSEQLTPTYKLQSVRSLVKDRLSLAPLTIAKTVIHTLNAPTTVFSVVVTSTALHACILHDSESLRKDIPDLIRFKVAAKNNITRWYDSDVTLRPTEGGIVSIYDYRTESFVPYSGDDNNSLRPTILGPFAYFLSTINVDRLEPSFIISPLHSKANPEPNSMDIVILRPRRDPTMLEGSEDRHTRYAEKIGSMFSAAYRKGAHVNLVYAENGTVGVDENSEGGVSFVEYVRCGGWEWIPKDTDEAAHLLCADGSILTIGVGGKAECRIFNGSNVSFWIYM